MLESINRPPGVKKELPFPEVAFALGLTFRAYIIPIFKILGGDLKQVIYGVSPSLIAPGTGVIKTTDVAAADRRGIDDEIIIRAVGARQTAGKEEASDKQEPP